MIFWREFGVSEYHYFLFCMYVFFCMYVYIYTYIYIYVYIYLTIYYILIFLSKERLHVLHDIVVCMGMGTE